MARFGVEHTLVVKNLPCSTNIARKGKAFEKMHSRIAHPSSPSHPCIIASIVAKIKHDLIIAMSLIFDIVFRRYEMNVRGDGRIDHPLVVGR